MFQEAVKKAAEGDLPWMLVLLVFFLLQVLLIKSVYRPWVDSKTEEIKRLVKERDKLQDMVLKHRLHAGVDDQGKSTRQSGRNKK